MREVRIQFVSANVLTQQSGSHLDLRYRDRFLRNRGSRCERSVPLRNLRFGFDTDKRYQVTSQRPAPIEETMIAVKFCVVDRISFAQQCVSQITVGREQRRVYHGRSIGRRRNKRTPPPGPFQQSGFEREAQRQTRAGGELAVQPLVLLFSIGLPRESTRLGKHVAENLRVLKPYKSRLQSAQARAADDRLVRAAGRVVVGARPGNNLLGQKVSVC